MSILSGLVEFCCYRKTRTLVNGPLRPRLRAAVLISAALVLLCRWTVAAPAEASWSGVLRDNSGTPIVGVTVVLSDGSGKSAYTATTTADGWVCVFSDCARDL